MHRLALTASLLVFLSGFGGGSAARAGQFELLSEDGAARLQFSLLAQMRWDYGYHLGGGKPEGTDNRLYFRRLRPILQARLAEDRLRFKLHLSTLPGALELMDLWGEWRFGQWLRLRVGQAKVPFTRHRLNSFTVQTLVDWSAPTRYFGAERQLGVMLHNGVAAPARLEYQLGWYTGVNARAANGIGPALIYTEALASPSDLVDPDPGLLEQMHSELVLHLAYNSPGLQPDRPYDYQRGPWRWGAGLSLAWDLAPRPGRDFRMRLAPEFLLRGRGWGLDAVFYLALVDLTTGADSYYPGVLGGLLELSWSPVAGLVLACRYSQVTVRRRVLDDARERNSLLGRETSPEGQKRSERQVLLGVAWQLLGSTLQLQADLGWQQVDYEQDSETGWLGRLQLLLTL